MENCIVNLTEEGARITSTIIGFYDGTVYRVEYLIKTNANWETILVGINSSVNEKTSTIHLEKDDKGNWLSDGRTADEYLGCMDIDIPLTPFTNTLPIRRLKLKPNEQEEIRVIYIDPLRKKINAVRQRYVCISDTRYRYENVPNDFEAVIEVDQYGLVIDYPPLFMRSAALISDEP